MTSVSMNIAESNELFSQLPESIRNAFYAAASKSDSGQTARQFFHTEIPDVVKSDPEGIDLLLNGGSVTVPVDTFEIGRASTGTDTVEYQLPDRDFSRVVSGENGGDYTSENVVLEDSSINRSRQETDMSTSELETAETSLEVDADIIANRVSDINTDAVDAVDSVDALDVVSDAILPAAVAAKTAHAVWKSTEHMDSNDRIAVTAATGTGAALGTIALCANPVTGPFVLGGAAIYSAVSLFNLVNRKLG